MCNSNNYQAIACHLHDYIEIICMKQWDITITPKTGSAFIALPLTTETLANKTEWLIYMLDDEKHRIRLDEISSIEPITQQADFGKIVF